MENYIADVMTLSQQCDCGNHHNAIPIEAIKIGNDALKEAARFIQRKAYQKVVIVADAQTYKAGVERLAEHLKEKNIPFSVTILKPDENNDVVADEKCLVQALLDIPTEADVLIAFGAGTIHDITRFCATKLKIPFISVPSAPSVDGFTSLGAPLIVRGVKTTFQMSSPIAVFADLTILQSAPREMIAAGFGDMMAKYTSLADWKLGHVAVGEPYCPLSAQITRDALENCVEHAEEIEAGDQKGVRILIEALIKSGLAMLLFGQSHPASGGEHHLSHYWEMEFLKLGRPAVLHGAKVSVATLLLADIYNREFLELITEEKNMENIDDPFIVKNIQEHLPVIQSIYEEIPQPERLREILEKLNGAVTPAELGISEELVNRSLQEAHHLRNRFTALKFLNEVAKVSPQYV